MGRRGSPRSTEYGEVAIMRVQIGENSATLTPFGSLAPIVSNVPTAESKSWSELIRLVVSQTRQKRSDEIPTEPQN